MILAEPPPSSADIRFRVAGIPVRIHPGFWFVTAVLGLSGNRESGTPPEELLVWVGAVLASILIHELGHAVVQRRCGGRPWITLYAMGGLASSDEVAGSPRNQILISLAGPLAGFLAALLVMTLLWTTGHVIGWSAGSPIAVEEPVELNGMSVLGLTLYWESLGSSAGSHLVFSLMWINVYWGLVNLLPIYPLDGGQIAREVCQLVRGGHRGIVLSLQLSMVAAGLMAAGGLARQQLFITMFFGYLAYQSYQIWSAYRAHYFR